MPMRMSDGDASAVESKREKARFEEVERVRAEGVCQGNNGKFERSKSTVTSIIHRWRDPYFKILSARDVP